MKALALVAAVAALFLTGCGSEEPVKTAVNLPQAAPIAVSVGDYELGTPIVADNVTVVPVMLKTTPTEKGDEMTLAEAKKLGMVEIIEIPGAEEVSHLRVHNKSDRPLLLLGGELLLGGKQDRIVVHDVIIPPGATQEVEVRCVEHGRWDGATVHFEGSAKIVPSSVREAAAYETQDKVWDNVGQFNSMAAASPSTQTIQGGLNSPEVDKRVQAQMPEVAKALAGNDRAVGVIYVLNGEIRSMDVFGSPRLFQASKESLLNGFLAEGAVVKGKADKTPSTEEYRTFVSDALSGKREQKAGEDVYFLSGSTMKGNEVRRKESGDGAAGGVFVHGSYSKGK